MSRVGRGEVKEIDSIPGPKRHAKFADSSADGFDIAEITSSQSLQAEPDSCLCALVAQSVEPVGERDPSVLALIAEQFQF